MQGIQNSLKDSIHICIKYFLLKLSLSALDPQSPGRRNNLPGDNLFLLPGNNLPLHDSFFLEFFLKKLFLVYNSITSTIMNVVPMVNLQVLFRKSFDLEPLLIPPSGGG